MTRVSPKGFTLIEILVVIGVIAILSTVSAVAFRSMYQSATRTSGANEVFEALTGARSNTLASKNDTVHGIHMSSTTITRFEGPAYVPGASGNRVYTFEGNVLATSTIISNGGVVTFSRLSGIPSATGTVYVYDATGAGTTTLIIQGSGLVEYN